MSATGGGRCEGPAVPDKPSGAGGWGPGELADPCGVIAQDIGGLLRELAEARTVAADRLKEGREQTRRLLLAILEVMDGFERVFQAINAKKDQCTPLMNVWVGNFRTVYRLLGRALADFEVTPIESLRQGFDPRYHKAFETVCDPSHPEGTILEETVRGYMWQEAVLRKAEVRVVSHDQPPPAAEGEGPGSRDEGRGTKDEGRRTKEDPNPES